MLVYYLSSNHNFTWHSKFSLRMKKKRENCFSYWNKSICLVYVQIQKVSQVRLKLFAHLYLQLLLRFTITVSCWNLYATIFYTKSWISRYLELHKFLFLFSPTNWQRSLNFHVCHFPWKLPQILKQHEEFSLNPYTTCLTA